MSNEVKWYCHAMKKEIPEGQCYEYFYAERGGPDDTARALKEWISKTKLFKSIEEFHKVCDEKCPRQ
ncbi:MAG: hypothetical protein ACOY46_02430 [Bacillota bacterium]